LAAPGSLPAQIAYKMARSITGQLRIDYALTSVIINPAAGVALLLNHVKKEVLQIVLPAVTPPVLPPLAIPGMPAPPVPPAAAMVAIDLGIKIVQGIEVQGKQFTLPPLVPPPPPALPGLPGAPALPALAAALPTIAETWISTKLLMPVLTRITGSFGQQMCHCKNTVPGEPPPTAFQVPPDYKQIGLPPAPAPPAPPAMPGAPAMPAAPAIPGAPKMPAAPAMPGAPAAPAMPAAPSMPKPPKPPGFSF
jgi:hypothetical protein